MRINYNAEKRNFDKEHENMREKYLKAGMTEEQIQEIFTMDLKQFNRDIAYKKHTQELLVDNEPDTEEQAVLLRKQLESLSVEAHEMEDTFSWLDGIEIEPLATELSKLSTEHKHLLTLVFKQEMTQKEVSQRFDIPESTLSRTLSKLLNALKTATVDTAFRSYRHCNPNLYSSLQESRKRGEIICLCKNCKEEYIAAGYRLRRVQNYQMNLDICTRCSYRKGFDYYKSRHKSSDKCKGGSR